METNKQISNWHIPSAFTLKIHSVLERIGFYLRIVPDGVFIDFISIFVYLSLPFDQETFGDKAAGDRNGELSITNIGDFRCFIFCIEDLLCT